MNNAVTGPDWSFSGCKKNLVSSSHEPELQGSKNGPITQVFGFGETRVSINLVSLANCIEAVMANT